MPCPVGMPESPQTGDSGGFWSRWLFWEAATRVAVGGQSLPMEPWGSDGVRVLQGPRLLSSPGTCIFPSWGLCGVEKAGGALLLRLLKLFRVLCRQNEASVPATPPSSADELRRLHQEHHTRVWNRM